MVEIAIENLFLPNSSKDKKKTSFDKSQKESYIKPFKKPYKNPFRKPKTNFKPNLKGVTCYKCGKKGHTIKYCEVSKKLQALQLEEETFQRIFARFIEISECKT